MGTFFLLMLFSAATCCFVLSEECPAQEDIFPCSCNDLEITCAGLKGDAGLKNTLDNLKKQPSIKVLKISDLTLSTLPTDLFSGLKVRTLKLQKIEVEDASFRPGRRHFLGLEKYLKGLDISDSFRTNGRNLIDLELDHLELLESVIFENNRIPEIRDDWFPVGLDRLRTVIFKKNGIETLSKEAFKHLINLQTLAVAGNDLNFITRSMFPAIADDLRALDLSYNKIREVPQDLFTDMPGLKNVNLEKNLIHVIDKSTFSKILPQLHFLMMDGNPFECGSEMEWVCKYDYARVHAKCAGSKGPRGLWIHMYCRNVNLRL